MAAIQITNLSKRFGDVQALQNVDLVVEEGEIFGFLGPNGAGKSTTIDVLLDFVRPTGGEAYVLGMDAQADTIAIRKRVGVLPDGYHVYDRLTGRQHVQFAIRSKGADDDPIELLERVGIAEAADRKAGEYSKGMTQRLVLAMALAGQPDLLILDEPSTGLDPNGAREMREIIRAERDRGATVFFSSHVLEQVEAICDRVAILDHGRIVTVDTIEGLRASSGAATELSITVDSVPAGVVDSLMAVPGVEAVTADEAGTAGGSIAVRLTDGSKSRILHEIEAAGATVEDFATRETSLEELFAAFTEDDERTVEATEPSASRPTDGPDPTATDVAEAAEVKK